MKKKKKVKEHAVKGKKKPVGKARLIARIVSISLVVAVVACCAVGDWYVHHPREWLEEHRAFYTAPLWYFGNRTAFVTDAIGWTGHDAVYDSDDPVPENQVFFAGAPERTGDPAPKDIVMLQRGEFAIGWSPSLRHPVWGSARTSKRTAASPRAPPRTTTPARDTTADTSCRTAPSSRATAPTNRRKPSS